MDADDEDEEGKSFDQSRRERKVHIPKGFIEYKEPPGTNCHHKTPEATSVYLSRLYKIDNHAYGGHRCEKQRSSVAELLRWPLIEQVCGMTFPNDFEDCFEKCLFVPLR